LDDAVISSVGKGEAKKVIAELYIKFEHTPGGVMANEGDGLLHGSDQRFDNAAKDIMESYAIDNVKEWVGPILKNGFLEVTIVGDVDVKSLVESVSQNLGAITAREGVPAPIDNPMGILSRKSVYLFFKPPLAKVLCNSYGQREMCRISTENDASTFWQKLLATECAKRLATISVKLTAPTPIISHTIYPKTMGKSVFPPWWMGIKSMILPS
jgi:hypothetical protein